MSSVLQILKERLQKLEQENATYKVLLEKHTIILPELEQAQPSVLVDVKESELSLFGVTNILA
jgi:flagellar motility protein MotE (MotC chaperone)